MPNNSIKDFKLGFNGGTRANRFIVSGFWPTGLGSLPTSTDLRIKIFASSLPRAEIGTVAIPFRGRAYYLPGDRQYSVWQIGVYDDIDVNPIWKAFNKWKEAMDGHETHTVANNNFSYSNLQKNWTVQQLGLDNSILRTINLKNCWPSEIGNITLDMGSTEPSSFNVTMTFDYMDIDNVN
jgi:hypothetical protein